MWPVEKQMIVEEKGTFLIKICEQKTLQKKTVNDLHTDCMEMKMNEPDALSPTLASLFLYICLGKRSSCSVSCLDPIVRPALCLSMDIPAYTPLLSLFCLLLLCLSPISCLSSNPHHLYV